MPIMLASDGNDKVRQKKLDPDQTFVVDDGEALAELCAQGLGLTQVPHFIARDWIRKKAIVPIAPFYRPSGNGVWLIYAKRDYLPSRIRAFISFLEKRISESAETPYKTWVEDLGTPEGNHYN